MVTTLYIIKKYNLGVLFQLFFPMLHLRKLFVMRKSVESISLALKNLSNVLNQFTCNPKYLITQNIFGSCKYDYNGFKMVKWNSVLSHLRDPNITGDCTFNCSSSILNGVHKMPPGMPCSFVNLICMVHTRTSMSHHETQAGKSFVLEMKKMSKSSAAFPYSMSQILYNVSGECTHYDPVTWNPSPSAYKRLAFCDQ